MRLYIKYMFLFSNGRLTILSVTTIKENVVYHDGDVWLFCMFIAPDS